jgi:hypothetical protein
LFIWMSGRSNWMSQTPFLTLSSHRTWTKAHQSLGGMAALSMRVLLLFTCSYRVR